jgi:hypothetical protein
VNRDAMATIVAEAQAAVECVERATVLADAAGISVLRRSLRVLSGYIRNRVIAPASHCLREAPTGGDSDGGDERLLRARRASWAAREPLVDDE